MYLAIVGLLESRDILDMLDWLESNNFKCQKLERLNIMRVNTSSAILFCDGYW